jgi:hypothetical protein
MDWACGLCLLSALLVTTGCTPGKQSADLWEDYLSRLERVLETDIATRPVALSSYYPTRKILQRKTQNLSINLLELLSLLDCKLSRIIASRNSVLGKVMQASQQWLYEVALIKALEECIVQLEGYELSQQAPREVSPEVLSELQNILQIKKSELAKVVWNATFAGPEFQVFMSANKGALETDFQFAYYANLTASLAQLSQWTANPMFPGVSAEYEKINQQLVTYPVYGRLMYSLLEATTMLNSVSASLHRKLAERPLCFTHIPTPKARIMRNILVNIYNARVQPYIAELNKAHGEWHRLLAFISEGLPKESLGSYYSLNLTQNPQSIYGLFKNAAVEHAKVWTTLLEQCGLRPGNL